MARFLGAIEGRLGNVARRLGDDHMLAAVTAPDIGVLVNSSVEPDGREVFHLYATGGRRKKQPSCYLGRVLLEDGRLTFHPHILAPVPKVTP